MNGRGKRTVYRRLLGLLLTERGRLTLAMTLLLANLGMGLARPWILGEAVDALHAAEGNPEGIADIAFRFALLFLAVHAAMNLFRFLYGMVRGSMVHRILARMRMMALDKLHALSPSFYGSFDSGAVLARVSRDIQKVRAAFGMPVFSCVQMGIVVAAGLVLMGLHSPAIAMATVAVFALAMAFTFAPIRTLGLLTRRADDEYDGVALDIKENIEGVRVVKSFGREPEQRFRFRGKLGGYIDRAVEANDWWTLRLPHAQAIFGLSIPAVLLVGGWLHARGGIGPGAIVACVFYASAMFREFGALRRVVQQFQEALVSAERIFELYDDPRTIPQAGNPVPLPPGKGHLVLEGVRFAYPGSDKVLAGLDLEIRPGERVALVGPTGSGKSTVAALLLRFFDADAGRIRLDGTEIREIPVASLRRAIGCVFQETFLFSATLRENLAYARPEATDAELLAAARTAQLGEFIDGLEKGLDTVVGERGVTLSGGQKQRVAIARVLAADPRFLILDDAMASVDAETEREMTGALRRAAEGRTTLAITQRLSGVLLADRVVVMEAGRVVDGGTHAELLDRCDLYRELFGAQVLETAAAGGKEGA